LGNLLVRRRDRFLRELMPVVGAGWISRADFVWPLSVQHHRSVSHRPWWTCPVALGSWGSGGRFLRARPPRRRGITETVRRRSLWVHAPCGCGFVGRLLPVVPISLLRRLCCQGRQGGDRAICSSGRSFFGAVDSAPRVHLLDVSFSLTGPLCGFGTAAFAVGESGSSILLFGAGSGLPSRHRPNVCSSEQARGRSSVRPSGRSQGQPSVRPSGRARGVGQPPFGVHDRPADPLLFGAGGRCDARAMALWIGLSVGDRSFGPSGL